MAEEVRRAAAQAAELAERIRRRPAVTEADQQRMDRLTDELEQLARRTPVDARWRDALDAARVAADAMGKLGADAEGGEAAGPPGGSGSAAGSAEGPPEAEVELGEGASAPSSGGSGTRAAAGSLPPDLLPGDAAVVRAWLDRRSPDARD